MSKTLPDHIEGLFEYLSSSDEKANEDLVLKYFRKTFGKDFTRQEEADRSDGYVPGHFVLELKGKTNDWLAGLFQGIAYRKNLDFGVVVVVAKGLLALWALEDLGEELIQEVLKEKGAPNAIGKRLSLKYKDKRTQLLKKSAYQFPSEYLGGLFKGGSSVLLKEIDSFEKTLQKRKKVRHKITTKNFTTILKQMNEYFDPKMQMKTVRAFYSMVFGWHESSVLEISTKRPDQATLGGETIEHLIPGKRDKFKKFVESHYIHLNDNENEDDFFAMYDQALDAVDPKFRIKHGIFFTDLDLSKFVMWSVRKELGDIGKNYLVIDPACGSGNLVTNWRSPLELRHKVVSEIEPELLYTVEQRMKGDKWHNGKFTVVPKVSENTGLNFLDKSADEYVDTIKKYLTEKGQKANKPIAFLCNPPYRSDDDQAADSVKYKVHPSILELTGKDGSAERYSCFLAQMRLICEKAEESGLPEDSLLLLFTKAAWLTKRPVFESIRKNICSVFEDVGGMIVNSQEFFDVKGKFPIAFTMWKYKGANAGLDPNRPIELLDMTWLKKFQLTEIDWVDNDSVEKKCGLLTKDEKAKTISFGLEIPNIKEWSGLTRFDFQREKRKAEKTDSNFKCGLPSGDERHGRKKTLGECDGEFIGFMDDLTPCRINKNSDGKPWFYLENRFMRSRAFRCLSGPPDKYAYSASTPEITKKVFTWFALGRVFASHGYPMWVDADEMWPVIAPPRLEDRLTKLSFAIGFAENECIETIFPAGNPVKRAKEIRISNPLTPLDASSFWSQEMASFFKAKGTDPEDKLVSATSQIFNAWKKRLSNKKEIYVDYKTPYFVGDGILGIGAGLVQIRDFAKENNDEDLLRLFENMNLALKETKDEFKNLLHQKNGFNYFEINEKKLNSAVVSNEAISDTVKPRKGFDHVLDLRLALACKIVEDMSDTKEFSRVKFAKAFYLADVMSGVDLKTEYTREAAGPLDQRALYNEKIGIESIAVKNGYFETEKKKGKEFDFVQYSKGKNLRSGAETFEALFKGKTEEINKIIKLTSPMSRDQIEIVATLFASWNDLLISKRKFEDQDIFKEFKDRWHPEKSKKFQSIKGKKPRFTDKQLVDALAWMKEKGLVPKGSGKKTKAKHSKNDDLIPF